MHRLLAVVVLTSVAYADKVMVPDSGLAAPAAPATRTAPMPPGMRPPPPPAPTPPPPEVAALAKQLVGSYTCKGVVFVGNGASMPLTAKVSVKLALGGAWLVESFAETRSGGIAHEDYRTFDSVAKQWHRFELASSTGYTTYTSLGDSGGTWNWEGTATSPTGAMQVRDHETPGDHEVKAWGEALLGGGWQKLYEVTCKR